MNEGQLSPTTPNSPLPTTQPTPPAVAPTPAPSPVQPPPAPAMPTASPAVAPPPPPWMQQARPRPTPPAAPMAFAAQQARPAPTTPSADGKEWGPLKPIRKVPKPSEAKTAYVLAQTERVVLPEEDRSHRRSIIIGSIVAVLIIAGGTVAFVFFGREARTTSNTLQVVNAPLSNTNAVGTVNATNQNANSNTEPDTDGDGLSDSREQILGTNPNRMDSDGDGYSDGEEVRNGYNPAGPGKVSS